MAFASLYFHLSVFEDSCVTAIKFRLSEMRHLNNSLAMIILSETVTLLVQLCRNDDSPTVVILQRIETN